MIFLMGSRLRSGKNSNSLFPHRRKYKPLARKAKLSLKCNRKRILRAILRTIRNLGTFFFHRRSMHTWHTEKPLTARKTTCLLNFFDIFCFHLAVQTRRFSPYAFGTKQFKQGTVPKLTRRLSPELNRRQMPQQRRGVLLGPHGIQKAQQCLMLCNQSAKAK